MFPRNQGIFPATARISAMYIRYFNIKVHSFLLRGFEEALVDCNETRRHPEFHHGELGFAENCGNHLKIFCVNRGRGEYDG